MPLGIFVFCTYAVTTTAQAAISSPLINSNRLLTGLPFSLLPFYTQFSISSQDNSSIRECDPVSLLFSQPLEQFLLMVDAQ